MNGYRATAMPPRQPLAMVPQDFRTAPATRVVARASWVDMVWRLGAFAPALALTASLIYGMVDWFGSGGVSLLETVVIMLVGLTFIWVSLSVSTAVVGLLRRVGRAPKLRRTAPQKAQSVALLVPVYNETPWEVFGNAQAMLDDLARRSVRDRYALFVLSDTNDDAIAEQEWRAFAALRVQAPKGIDVHYRRRAQNTDRKVGNLSDWITGWGGGYDAMLVLDADSLMSGAAIRHLTRELAADPDAGLIQSFPMLIGAQTLFGRMQQFSNAVYGWLLAEGLAVWSLREGNYWGHNAIIRTRAFAGSAALPHLRGRGGTRDLILSHDFVEAGMLRRAGWAVRFLPVNTGSYEETPQTLIDYALRDRRWCQGNLQHLRLLTARGFHPISRFHLLQGAFAFLMSPAWLALLVIWSSLGAMPQGDAAYFAAANPLYPVWPQMSEISGWVYLAFIYAMLLLPKLAGTLALIFGRRSRARHGGAGRLLAAVLFEIACSVIYAPILMVQQSRAVWAAMRGTAKGWSPQRRGTQGYGWAASLRFHSFETVLGLGLTAAIGAGVASLWLVPIAVSLTLAVPLSRLSALPVAGWRGSVFRLDAPQDLQEPRIVASARIARARMQALLQTPAPQGIAAE